MSPTPSPSVIVFDVNETLSDLASLAERFLAVGAPAHRAPLWFATVLRDGFALSAVGDARPFAQLGAEALRTLLHDVDLRKDPAAGLDGSLESAVEHVLDGMGLDRPPRHPVPGVVHLPPGAREGSGGPAGPARRRGAVTHPALDATSTAAGERVVDPSRWLRYRAAKSAAGTGREKR
ncbi:hypothetical protein [Kineococcus sp. R86509]|uniref:hypothetical protein n=1 Tax=Kineococcus sp. R86509 TaxID=3093851 RepID=UPI0036D3D944